MGKNREDIKNERTKIKMTTVSLDRIYSSISECTHVDIGTAKYCYNRALEEQPIIFGDTQKSDRFLTSQAIKKQTV